MKNLLSVLIRFLTRELNTYLSITLNDLERPSSFHKHAEHFLEKSRLTCAISELVNLHLLADPTYPRNPKTFSQELRKKRMDLGLQIKELARLVHVTSDTIINPDSVNYTVLRQELIFGLFRAMISSYGAS